MNCRPARPRKEEWLPFPHGWPEGWYERFGISLAEDPNAERLRKYFIPRCDFVKIGAFAMAYVSDPQCFMRERKLRLEKHEADLIAEERHILAELCSPAWKPGEFGTPTDFFNSPSWQNAIRNAPKVEHLARVRENLARVRRLMNVREAGRKDLGWLLVIKEYLEAASGVLLRAADLAAIVDAAYLAANLDEADPTEALQLFQNLRRFGKRKPELVGLAHDEALLLRKSVQPLES